MNLLDIELDKNVIYKDLKNAPIEQVLRLIITKEIQLSLFLQDVQKRKSETMIEDLEKEIRLYVKRNFSEIKLSPIWERDKKSLDEHIREFLSSDGDVRNVANFSEYIRRHWTLKELVIK